MISEFEAECRRAEIARNLRLKAVEQAYDDACKKANLEFRAIWDAAEKKCEAKKKRALTKFCKDYH